MTVIRRYGDHTIRFATFLLLIFSSGCCNPSVNPELGATVAVPVAPLSGATSACPGTTITATFNEAMNPATINGMTFTLMRRGGAVVEGAVTYDIPSNTAMFTPTVSLALSTTYTATIKTGVRDAYGLALANNFMWGFTTGPNPCAAPTVTSETPTDGAIGVCPSTVVGAVFNEAMNPTTITGSTFTVTGPGTTPVIGTISSSGSTVVFTPSGALALDTIYTAEIWTGAQDVF